MKVNIIKHSLYYTNPKFKLFMYLKKNHHYCKNSAFLTRNHNLSFESEFKKIEKIEIDNKNEINEDQNQICVGRGFRIASITDLHHSITIPIQNSLIDHQKINLRNKHADMTNTSAEYSSISAISQTFSEEFNEVKKSAISMSIFATPKDKCFTGGKKSDYNNFSRKENRCFNKELITNYDREYLSENEIEKTSMKFYLTPALKRDLEKLREIILDAASCGDNVGIDEYEDSLEAWEKFFSFPEIFVVREILTSTGNGFKTNKNRSHTNDVDSDCRLTKKQAELFNSNDSKNRKIDASVFSVNCNIETATSKSENLELLQKNSFKRKHSETHLWIDSSSKVSHLNENEIVSDEDLLSDPQVFIVIDNCKTSRSFDSSLATILIFYTQELTRRIDKELLFTTFLNVGIQIIQELDLKYTECVVRVCPETNQDRVNKLLENGFKISAKVPDAVFIDGLLRTDYFMAKTIAPLRERRSQSEIREAINRICPSDIYDPLFKSTYSDSSLPTRYISFLPTFYRMPESGLRVLVSNMKQGDDLIIYRLMKVAAERGWGYGADEFPTLTAFRMWMLFDRYCCIYEHPGYISTKNETKEQDFEKTNSNRDDYFGKKLIGCTLTGESTFSRSKKSKAWETNLIINPEYRGARLSVDILKFENMAMKRMGYQCHLSDYISSNERVLKIIRIAYGIENFEQLGRIPRASYTSGVGWEDQIVYRFVKKEGDIN